MFMAITEKGTPDERADYLNNDVKLEETHQAAAVQGDTDPHQEQQEPSKCHFVTYVQKDNWIWELDGRLNAPVKKAPIDQGQHLGIEVAKIIKKYIEISGDIKFSVMALAPNLSDDFD